jgi:hypothetical protein
VRPAVPAAALAMNPRRDKLESSLLLVIPHSLVVFPSARILSEAFGDFG